jgi:transcriptional regulator with XRE-family HTH domain
MGQIKSYEHFLEKIAHNIIRVRKSKGLTQEGMVEFGFSYRHYQKVESGRHSLNLFTLFRLAQTFKVDIKEFFK